MSLNSSIDRIVKGQFSEADVNTIILYERENAPTKIFRELGDLVAHPIRNKGVINYAALDHYCHCCFLLKYQLKEPDQLSFSGSCDWFLKRFLRSQIKRYEPYEVKRVLKRSPKLILREINSYFPVGEEFPTKFGSDPKKYTVIASKRFEDILNFCARKMMIKPIEAFDFGSFSAEVEQLLKKYEIPILRRDDFIVCVCILLHNKNHFHEKREIGRTALTIGNNLSVFLSAHPPKHKDYDAAIAMPIFETPIKAIDYFGKDFCELMKHSTHNLERLSFGFSSFSCPKVSVSKMLEPTS